MSQLAKAMTVFAPNGDDWLVTVALRNRKVFTRRISPGTMSEQDAVSMAVRIGRFRQDDISDIVARRVGSSAKVEIASASDPFAALVLKMGIR